MTDRGNPSLDLRNRGFALGSSICWSTCETYRGEVQVIVLNASTEAFTVERGMRIAQAVLAPVVKAAWREVPELPETSRGAGGFGSTGTK